MKKKYIFNVRHTEECEGVEVCAESREEAENIIRNHGGKAKNLWFQADPDYAYGCNYDLEFVREEEDSNLKRWEELFANPKPITGYLLEFQDENGEWVGSEFDCYRYPWDRKRSSVWENNELADLFFRNELSVGFFPELGDARLESSDDWMGRLGVNFGADDTPVSDPHASGIWGGVTDKCCGFPERLWRVRRVTIKGEFSEKAKKFFRAHPEATLDLVGLRYWED